MGTADNSLAKGRGFNQVVATYGDQRPPNKHKITLCTKRPYIASGIHKVNVGRWLGDFCLTVEIAGNVLGV
ncbi:MAG: hypothetical protein EBY62_00345 [Cellvibrionales bacterium]|nr:hypothetical protein [Cellvibrionales bacterium]